MRGLLLPALLALAVVCSLGSGKEASGELGGGGWRNGGGAAPQPLARALLADDEPGANDSGMGANDGAEDSQGRLRNNRPYCIDNLECEDGKHCSTQGRCVADRTEKVGWGGRGKGKGKGEGESGARVPALPAIAAFDGGAGGRSRSHVRVPLLCGVRSMPTIHADDPCQLALHPTCLPHQCRRFWRGGGALGTVSAVGLDYFRPGGRHLRIPVFLCVLRVAQGGQRRL